jgi:hypothetical protein
MHVAFVRTPVGVLNMDRSMMLLSDKSAIAFSQLVVAEAYCALMRLYVRARDGDVYA